MKNETESPQKHEASGIPYVWTQCYLALTNLLYMRQSHDFVVRSRAFVKCPLPRRKKRLASKLAVSFFRLDWRFIHCFRVYYSMIVATRPDPTVRPPSRYQTGVLRYTNSDFLCDLCGKIRIFRCVRVVFRNFCYHGVITVFLVFLAYFFLHS